MENIQHIEETEFTHATDSEIDRDDATYGSEITSDPNEAWVCSNRDVWYRNPSYIGRPVMHPDETDGVATYEAERFPPVAIISPVNPIDPEDIPF